MAKQRLKIFERQQPVQHYVPENTRIYAIGDIHGHLTPLINLHAKIKKDDEWRPPVKRKIVICLGDYIDRGLQSSEVIDYLTSEPLKGFEYIFLKGNHEQALIDFIEGPARSTAWLAWGGDATLLSYRITLPQSLITQGELEMLAAELLSKIPISHKKFYSNLKLYHIEGDYLFVHAGMRPGIELEDQLEADMLMIREDFIKYKKPLPKKIIFGHTIFSEPYVDNYKIGVDTGSYATSKLTAVVLEQDRVEFLHSS